jgi:hypothetical protein
MTRSCLSNLVRSNVTRGDLSDSLVKLAQTCGDIADERGLSVRPPQNQPREFTCPLLREKTNNTICYHGGVPRQRSLPDPLSQLDLEQHLRRPACRLSKNMQQGKITPHPRSYPPPPCTDPSSVQVASQMHPSNHDPKLPRSWKPSCGRSWGSTPSCAWPFLHLP